MTILAKLLGAHSLEFILFKPSSLKRVTFSIHNKTNQSFSLLKRLEIKFFSTTIMATENGEVGQTKDPDRKPFRRLPTAVVPSNYNITLQPDLQSFKFKGNEVIDLQVILISYFTLNLHFIYNFITLVLDLLILYVQLALKFLISYHINCRMDSIATSDIKTKRK